jgi:hypothetical protein
MVIESAVTPGALALLGPVDGALLDGALLDDTLPDGEVVTDVEPFEELPHAAAKLDTTATLAAAQKMRFLMVPP